MEIKPFVFGLNHLAFSVSNLDKSITFYTQVMGFKYKERPTFDFPGAWFDMGNNQELHLIENIDLNIDFSGSRSLHFAFEVQNLLSVKDRLRALKIDITKDISARPDGVLQLFIQDPDGYYIEFTQLNK